MNNLKPYYLRNNFGDYVYAYKNMPKYKDLFQDAKFTEDFFYDVYSNRFVGNRLGKNFICLGTGSVGRFPSIDTFNGKDKTPQERLNKIVVATKKHIDEFFEEDSFYNKNDYICLYDMSVNDVNFFAHLVFAPVVEIVPPFYKNEGYVVGNEGDSRIYNRAYMWMHRTMGQLIDDSFFVKNIEDVFKLTGLPTKNVQDHITRAKNAAKILEGVDTKFVSPKERVVYFTIKSNVVKNLEINSCKHFADGYFAFGVDRHFEPFKNIESFNAEELVFNSYYSKMHSISLLNKLPVLIDYCENEHKNIYQKIIVANASVKNLKQPTTKRQTQNQEKLKEAFVTILSKNEIEKNEENNTMVLSGRK